MDEQKNINENPLREGTVAYCPECNGRSKVFIGREGEAFSSCCFAPLTEAF